MKRVTSASFLLSLVTGMLVLVLVTVFALSALDALRREQNTSRVLSSARRSPARSCWCAKPCGWNWA